MSRLVSSFSFVWIYLSLACRSAPVPSPVRADHPASPAAPEASIWTPTSQREARAEASPPRAAPASEGLYVCPMHPEVHSAAPDRCSICGMQLVAGEVEAHEDGGKR